MKHILITIAAVLLVGCAPTLVHAKSRKYEVLVYGATPAGVCASVAAAREGASVALLSPYDYVGGMLTGGLSFERRKSVCSPVDGRFVRRVLPTHPQTL